MEESTSQGLPVKEESKNTEESHEGARVRAPWNPCLPVSAPPLALHTRPSTLPPGVLLHSSAQGHKGSALEAHRTAYDAAGTGNRIQANETTCQRENAHSSSSTETVSGNTPSEEGGPRGAVSFTWPPARGQSPWRMGHRVLSPSEA